MAMVSQSGWDIFVDGPGGVRCKMAILTLASGECEFPHGLNTILGGFVTPIAASSAVAAQTLTITGLTIPNGSSSVGFATQSNGISTIKSSAGSSTIQVFAAIWGT